MLTIFIGMLLLSMIMPSMAETDDLIIPELQIDEFSYELNDNYDIYVKNEQFHKIVDETFDFQSATMNQIIFFEENYNWGDQYTGISQYTNSSNVLDQKLEYSRNYYQLYSNDSKSGDQIFLESGRTYLFSLDITADEVFLPMILEFLFTQVSGGTTFSLTIDIVDPEGNSDTIVLTTIRDIVQMAPMIPKVEGSHIVGITTDRNVILSNMNINFSPEITELTDGYVERVQEDTTVSRFFKLDSEGNTKILDLSTLFYQKPYYVDLLNTLTFGSVVSYNFGITSGGIFGGGTLPNQDIYYVMIISPSDPANVLVQKAKEEKIYERGIDFEITLTLQKSSIEQLKLNKDFDTKIIDSYSKDNNMRIYSFEAGSNVLMGVNSSTANPFTDITFVSNDTTLPAITMNPSANDILNDDSDDFVVIPQGRYSVYIPTEESYRLTTMNYTSLGVNEEKVISTTFGEELYFELPTSVYTEDYFNITYNDRLNETVEIDFTLYGSDGAIYNTFTRNFRHYYFDNDPNVNVIDLVLNVFNLTNFNGFVNLKGGYIKLKVIGNERYNSTSGELLYSDATNITSQITIERMNKFEVNQVLFPSNLYYVDTLTTDITHSFFDTNNTVINYVSLSTEAEMVYKLTVDVVNRTISDFDLDLGNNLWYNSLTQLTSVNISNADHYILTIEFVSTVSLFMAIKLTLGTQNLNGTYSITLEKFTYDDIGMVSLPALNINDFITILEGENLFKNPLFWGAVVGGIAIIAAIVFIIKKKKGSFV